MIQVLAHYPWGEKYIKYDSWVFKCILVNRKDKENNPLPDLIMGIQEFTEQDEYERWMKVFNDDKRVDMENSPNEFKEHNMNYYTVKHKDHTYVAYVQGFLSTEQ